MSFKKNNINITRMRSKKMVFSLVMLLYFFSIFQMVKTVDCPSLQKIDIEQQSYDCVSNFQSVVKNGYGEGSFGYLSIFSSLIVILVVLYYIYWRWCDIFNKLKEYSWWKKIFILQIFILSIFAMVSVFFAISSYNGQICFNYKCQQISLLQYIYRLCMVIPEILVAGNIITVTILSSPYLVYIFYLNFKRASK